MWLCYYKFIVNPGIINLLFFFIQGTRILEVEVLVKGTCTLTFIPLDDKQVVAWRKTLEERKVIHLKIRVEKSQRIKNIKHL